MPREAVGPDQHTPSTRAEMSSGEGRDLIGRQIPRAGGTAWRLVAWAIVAAVEVILALDERVVRSHVSSWDPRGLVRDTAAMICSIAPVVVARPARAAPPPSRAI